MSIFREQLLEGLFMNKKAIVGIFLSIMMTAIVGCTGAGAHNGAQEGQDLKPVIYLYPLEDNTEISVSLDYNGNLVDLIPEFNADKTWNVTANRDGKITFEGKTYDYLFWEGDPNYSYDFYSGFCVKGEDTKSFLEDKLTVLGLNEAERAEFIEFWLPMMEKNPYNLISFQDTTYNNNAKLSVTPAPDTMIRVFMAWYPTDKYIKINPQYLESPSRGGFTVVEWGGNKVK
jgi:hypothetical protein